MGSGTGLDLKLIAQNCGIFSNLDSGLVISGIDGLKDNYNSSELINIYNYMLIHAQEPDVIMYLIRCVDMYRDSSSLEYLVDILLLKKGFISGKVKSS